MRNTSLEPLMKLDLFNLAAIAWGNWIVMGWDWLKLVGWIPMTTESPQGSAPTDVGCYQLQLQIFIHLFSLSTHQLRLKSSSGHTKDSFRSGGSVCWVSRTQQRLVANDGNRPGRHPRRNQFSITRARLGVDRKFLSHVTSETRSTDPVPKPRNWNKSFCDKKNYGKLIETISERLSVEKYV